MVVLPTPDFKSGAIDHSANPLKMCGRWESNPQLADFKSDASAISPLPLVEPLGLEPRTNRLKGGYSNH